jgi:DNA-binding NarL/FixJ family response regulator
VNDGSVLICCPNAVIRHGLQFVLGQFGIPTYLDPGDFEDMSQRMRNGDIRAVVVDSNLPSGGALRALAVAVRCDPAIPVVLLLDPGAESTMPWGLFQGAVSSHDDGRQLLAAITATEAGGTYLDPTLARRLVKASSGISLTAREQQVLTLAAEGASTKEIAERLHVSVDTAKTHVTNTMRKLGVDSRAAAIAIAYRDGLLVSSEQFRLEVRGEHPRTHGHWLLDDFAENARATLTYLHEQLGLGLWVVTQHDKDRWVALQANGTYYDIKPGTVMRWSDAFCSKMVSGEGPRTAANIDEEPVYASMRDAQGLQVNAYLGAPIELHGGDVFGSVCALDPDPQSADELERVLPVAEDLAMLLGRQASMNVSVSPIR